MKKKYLILITVGVIVLVLIGINFVGAPEPVLYLPQAWTKTTDNRSANISKSTKRQQRYRCST